LQLTCDLLAQPELTIITAAQLASHIRLHSTPTNGLLIRPLREAIQPPQMALPMFDELEANGSILIMRTLGTFRDTALPPLGRKNADGLGINDSDKGGGARLKSVFWDEVRERGRAGKRVEDGQCHSIQSDGCLDSGWS
jgi:transcription initiation factor TFIIE subunit beta